MVALALVMVLVRVVVGIESPGAKIELRRPVLRRQNAMKIEVDGDWKKPGTWSPRQRRKALSLIVLTVQNSALTLTMRWSRRKAVYLASEAVVMSEVCKALLSLCFAAATKKNESNIIHKLFAAIRDAYAEEGSYVLVVPAALYAIQNNLQYVAATHLEPAAFQLLYQMKLLWTAFFSVLLLGRRLKPNQLSAVGLLALGLGLASLGTCSSAVVPPDASLSITKDTTLFSSVSRGFTIGFFAVFFACALSGFSSVYFERVVKIKRKQQKHPISVWVRSAQLATFSSTIAALGAFLKDGHNIRARGILRGFTPLVWTVVALQAGGGMCTAAVIAYADNLLKGFATGVSMLFCAVASYFWFDTVIALPFVFGASAVIAAIFLYSS